MTVLETVIVLAVPFTVVRGVIGIVPVRNVLTRGRRVVGLVTCSAPTTLAACRVGRVTHVLPAMAVLGTTTGALLVPIAIEVRTARVVPSLHVTAHAIFDPATSTCTARRIGGFPHVLVVVGAAPVGIGRVPIAIVMGAVRIVPSRCVLTRRGYLRLTRLSRDITADFRQNEECHCEKTCCRKAYIHYQFYCLFAFLFCFRAFILRLRLLFPFFNERNSAVREMMPIIERDCYLLRPVLIESVMLLHENNDIHKVRVMMTYSMVGILDGGLAPSVT